MVPFFGNYDYGTLKKICNRFEQRFYEQDELIVRKGEEGTRMFLLVSREIGIYEDEACKSMSRRVTKDKVFGDRALLTKEKRAYNAIAHMPSLILILNKNDYNDQVYHLE